MATRRGVPSRWLSLLFVALALGIVRFQELEAGVLVNAGNVLVLRALPSASETQLLRAERILLSAAKMNTLVPSACRTLAYVYEESKRYDRMEAVLRDGLSVAPNDVFLQYRAGNMYFSTARMDLAVPAWRKARAAPHFFFRAVDADSRGDSTQALRDLEIATLIEPNVSDPYYLRGRIFQLQGLWHEAQVNYAFAVEKRTFVWQPPTDDVWLSRAYAGLGYATYQASGNLEDALSALEAAVTLGPGEPWSYIYLCEVNLRAGRTEVALEWANKAVALMPDQHWSYSARGRAYMHAGEYELAKRDFEAALALDSSAAWARSELARALQLLSER